MTSSFSKESRMEKFLKYATIISVVPLATVIFTLIVMVIAVLTGHSNFAANGWTYYF